MKGLGNRFIYFMAFILGFGGSAVVYAGYDYKFDAPVSNTDQYESEVGGKLSRGINNTFFGWTELFRTPIQLADSTEHGDVYAVTVGVPLGILRLVGRTLVGVYEVVTFYAPQQPIFSDLRGDIL